jgi:hypothetical protein
VSTPASPTAAEFLTLQRTVGNSAVASLVAEPGVYIHRCGVTPTGQCPCHDVQGKGTAVGAASSSLKRVAQAIQRTRSIPDLRHTGVNPAGAGAIQASPDAGTVAPPTEGKTVDRIGVVDAKKTGGLTLRENWTDKSPPIGGIRALVHGKTHVYVQKDMGHGWFYVAVLDEPLKGATGYVAGAYINTDMPPDPSQPDAKAELHTVQAGEQGHVFVRNHPAYRGETQKKGQDERFFTNVLLHVNELKKKKGVYKKTVLRMKPGMLVPMQVEEVWLQAGEDIWVPSLEFALSLKGKVSAGSWARDWWEKVKGFAEKVAGVGAFIAGLVVGVLESIKDMIVGALEFLWDTLKSLGANLVQIAETIYDVVTNADKRKQMKDALLEALDQKLRSMWDAKGFLRRWYNRGWLIGYATMEIVSLVLPAGAAAAAMKGSKFAGQAARLLNALGDSKIMSAVGSTSKKVIDKLAAAGHKTTAAVKGASAAGKSGLASTLGALGALAAWALKKLKRRKGPRRIPQGLTKKQWTQASAVLRKGTAHIPGEVAVHGSRAAGKAKKASDLDVALRVSEDAFNTVLAKRFKNVNPGSAKWRTMEHARKTGKIQAGEAGLRPIRIELEKLLGMEVDISVIRIGGDFDVGPFVPLL